MVVQQEIEQLAFLYLVHDKSNAKDIKFLDAIVHLYNYLEIFRKEYVEEELKD